MTPLVLVVDNRSTWGIASPLPNLNSSICASCEDRHDLETLHSRSWDLSQLYIQQTKTTMSSHPRLLIQPDLCKANWCSQYTMFVNYRSTLDDGPVTSRSLKKRPVFLRVWPSHAYLFWRNLNEKNTFWTTSYDWELGHKCDLKQNVTLSRFLELGLRSNLLRYDVFQT